MKELTLEEAAIAWAQGKRVLAAPPGSVNWRPITKLGGGEGHYTPNVFNEEKEPFRFRLAPEPPAVGTADWANSLPEGTKIRCNMGAWTAGRFTEKRNGVWSKWSEYAYTPDDKKDGWELYQEPPAKKFRPWTLAEVPVGSVIRWKTERSSVLTLIVSAHETDQGAVWICGGQAKTWNAEGVVQLMHSLDNGKTWLPCGVEVNA